MAAQAGRRRWWIAGTAPRIAHNGAETASRAVFLVSKGPSDALWPPWRRLAVPIPARCPVPGRRTCHRDACRHYRRGAGGRCAHPEALRSLPDVRLRRSVDLQICIWRVDAAFGGAPPVAGARVLLALAEIAAAWAVAVARVGQLGVLRGLEWLRNSSVPSSIPWFGLTTFIRKS